MNPELLEFQRGLDEALRQAAAAQPGVATIPTIHYLLLVLALFAAVMALDLALSSTESKYGDVVARGVMKFTAYGSFVVFSIVVLSLAIQILAVTLGVTL